MSIRDGLKRAVVTPEINSCINRIPKPVGSFGYDPWGYNTDGLKVWMGLFKPLYDHYFRVQTFGLEHVPKTKRVLIVANHSGQLPIDGALIGVALATNPYGPRAPRMMVERWLPTLPFIGNAFNEAGAVVGDPVNCVKMLRNEEAVVVFPEGIKGSGKAFSKRYQLQKFGSGFMHIAMEENVPIVPVGVVGCEETLPSLGNFAMLAYLLRMPYFPICPILPLPARVRLYFGRPMVFKGEIQSEQEVLRNVHRVRYAIEGLIAQGLKERKGWFQ